MDATTAIAAASNNLQLCRICISTNSNCTQMISIFGEDLLWRKITTLADVKIEKGDTLPQQVCVSCAKNAISACLFKKKCEDADNFFRQHLLIQKIEGRTSSVGADGLPLSEEEERCLEAAQHQHRYVTEYGENHVVGKEEPDDEEEEDDDEQNNGGLIAGEDGEIKCANGKQPPFDLNSIRLMHEYMQQQLCKINGAHSAGSDSDGAGDDEEPLPLVPEIELITPSDEVSGGGSIGGVGGASVSGRTTTAMRGYQCPTCFQIFEMKQILKAHMQSVHGTPGPVYECSNCKKTYFYKRFLEKHVRRGRCVKKRRNQTRPMQCSDCHVLFPTGHHLGWHKRTGCPSRAAKMPLQQLFKQNIVQYNNFPKRIGIRKPENAIYMHNRKLIMANNKRKGRTRIKLDAKKIALAKQLILREATTTVIANELNISRTFAWRLRKSLVNGVSLHERVIDPNVEEAGAELTPEAEQQAYLQAQNEQYLQQQQQQQELQQQALLQQQQQQQQQHYEHVIKIEKPDSDEDEVMEEQVEERAHVHSLAQAKQNSKDDDAAANDNDDDDDDDDDAAAELQMRQRMEQRQQQQQQQQRLAQYEQQHKQQHNGADKRDERDVARAEHDNADDDEDNDDDSDDDNNDDDDDEEQQTDDELQTPQTAAAKFKAQQQQQYLLKLAAREREEGMITQKDVDFLRQKQTNGGGGVKAMPLLSQFSPAVAAAINQLPVNLSIRPISSMQNNAESSSPNSSSRQTQQKKPRKPNVFIDDEKYAMAKMLVAQNSSTMEIARALNVSQMTAWKVRDAIVKGVPLSYRSKKDMSNIVKNENEAVAAALGVNNDTLTDHEQQQLLLQKQQQHLQLQQQRQQQQQQQQLQKQQLQKQQQLLLLQKQQQQQQQQLQQLQLQQQQQQQQQQAEQQQRAQAQQQQQRAQAQQQQQRAQAQQPTTSAGAANTKIVHPRRRLKAAEREQRDKEITREILELIKEDSNIQYWKVSARLAEKGYPISPSSVCQKLKSMGIHRRWKPGDKPPMLDMEQLKVAASVATSVANSSSADESYEQQFDMGGAHFLSAFTR